MAQQKAIFNGVQSGKLPSISLTRDTAKEDIVDGGNIAVNTPAYGHAAARSRFNEWVETLDDATTWNVPVTGYDSDGVTKLAAAFRATGGVWAFWLNTDIDGDVANDSGSAIYEFTAIRATSQTVNEASSGTSTVFDIMQGASVAAGDVLHSESTVALRPKSGICLPGCFIFVCERMRNTTGIIWKTEGIALVAMQHDGNNNFTRKWLGDLQTDYLADPFFSGWHRGREWASTSYFPFTLNQTPVLRAFFPFTDYIQDGAQGTPKKGGQVGIIEATRTNDSTEWSFGAIFKIPFEEETDGVHFHSAVWTPRGVVVSMGDTVSLNENILCTCSDWDDYTTGGNWTIIRRAYGSTDFSGTDPEHGYGNQWAGGIPHPTDINKVIVGGDNVASGIYELEVLADNTLSYAPLWGYLPGNDAQGHVCLGMSGPGPERHRPILGRCVQQQDSGTLHAPLVVSTDGVTFAAVARTPSTGIASNNFRIHGDHIYSFNLGGTSSIHKLPIPKVLANRGLAIGPGGTNLLEIDGTDYYSDVAFGSTTISTVSDSSAPNSNPVLDVETLSSSSNTKLFRINVSEGTYAFSATAAYFVAWFKDMENSGIPIRMTWNDNGAGGDTTYTGKGLYTGISVGDWNLIVFTIENAATPWANPHKATLTFSHAAALIGPSHFRMQVQGIYEGPQCPYYIAPATTSANEEAEQTLVGLESSWTIGIELHVPMSGEDYNITTQATSIKNTIALATVYVDANNYILMTADLANDEIDFDTIVTGSSIGITTLTNVSIQRDNTILLGVTFDGTNLDFYAACGGLDESGLSTGTDVGNIGTPATVRIGAKDFAEVPNTELNMIAVDTKQDLTAAAFLNLMADFSESDAGGSGYAAMSHANLVTPKII